MTSRLVFRRIVCVKTANTLVCFELSYILGALFACDVFKVFFYLIFCIIDFYEYEYIFDSGSYVAGK